MDAARRFAEVLEIPAFLVDTDGVLLFYNPPAAEILGRSYEETGPMAASVWGRLFIPTDESGIPQDPESLPLMVALTEKKPATGTLWIKGIDNATRHITVAAIPILGKENRLFGAIALFWESPKKVPGGAGR
jgi:hypothetical protein